MDFKVSLQKGLGVNGADLLLFEGCLNVQNVQAIKINLLEQLSEGSALHVKIENAEQFDLSFLQLLLGLKLKLKDERRPVYFDLVPNQEMESILAASGFGELLLAKY